MYRTLDARGCLLHGSARDGATPLYASAVSITASPHRAVFLADTKAVACRSRPFLITNVPDITRRAGTDKPSPLIVN